MNVPDPQQGPPRFDPYTGRPLLPPPPPVPRFDPYTGRPLAQPTHTDEPAHREPRPPRRNGLRVALFLLLVCLASGGVTAAVVLSGPSEDEAATAEVADELADDQKTCHKALDPTLDALGTVDSRLNVGLTMSDYSALVGDASVERDRIDESDIEGIEFCESALEGMDTALMSYSLIASTWNDCIFESGCDPDRDLDLSNSWSINSETMDAVHQAVEDGEPIDPDSEVGERIAMLTEVGSILEDS